MKTINKTRLRSTALVPSIGLWPGFMVLFTMTVCLFQASHAQIVEGIDEFHGFTTRNTIVRTIEEESSLIYSHDGKSGYFVLYDHAAFQAYKAKFIPNAIVNDFEVHNGWAYFCGQIDLGWIKVGLVGQFNIMDFFYNGGTIYYRPMDFMPSPWVVVITNAKRMTVYDDGTDVFIYATGIGLHGYPTYPSYNASTMFSATMNLSTLEWNFCINYNKDRKLHYIDIDCSENYVGFTAVDSVDSVYIGISKHPDTCFFYAGAPDVYAIGTHAEKERVLITGMKSDRFTVAYQPKHSRWIEFVQVPLPISNPFKATDTDSLQNAPAFNTWALQELRYSDMTDKVLLVGEMAFEPCSDHGGLDTCIVDYDWSGTISSRIPEHRGKLLSVDKHTNTSRYIFTGICNIDGDLTFYVDDIPSPVTESCFQKCTISAEWNERTHKWDYANTDETRWMIQTEMYSPEIIPIDVSIMCR